MASIVLSIIGCIDYLAYGTIFTRAMFLPKKTLMFFFFARKAVDERWEVVPRPSLNFLMDALLAPKTRGRRVTRMVCAP